MIFKKKYAILSLLLILNYNLIGGDSTRSTTPNPRLDPYDDSSFFHVLTSPTENQLALALYKRDTTQYVTSSNPTGSTPEQLAEITGLKERVKTLEKEREDSIKRREKEAATAKKAILLCQKQKTTSELETLIKRLREEKDRLAKENAKLKEENAALKLKTRIP